MQNSTRGELRKLWDGVAALQGVDDDVLSPLLLVQGEKVRNGSYAFISDKYTALLNISQNCNLAIAPEELLPFYYAVGLQKESPYRTMFSNV